MDRSTRALVVLCSLAIAGKALFVDAANKIGFSDKQPYGCLDIWISA